LVRVGCDEVAAINRTPAKLAGRLRRRWRGERDEGKGYQVTHGVILLAPA
jgi:hypothetical protein